MMTSGRAFSESGAAATGKARRGGELVWFHEVKTPRLDARLRLRLLAARRRGRVVRQRPAKPRTPVRIWSAPLRREIRPAARAMMISRRSAAAGERLRPRRAE